MIAYLSQEDSETYVQTAKHIGELPAGMNILILATEVTKTEVDLMEQTVSRYVEYTRKENEKLTRRF